MNLGIAIRSLLLSSLWVVPLVSLNAQSPMSAAKKAKMERQMEKNFDIYNVSKVTWKVGLDSDVNMVGKIEIKEFDDQKEVWKTLGNLDGTKELEIKANEMLILAPVPPKNIVGMKTGKDFAGSLYLKDPAGKMVHIELRRYTKSDNEIDKVPYWSPRLKSGLTWQNAKEVVSGEPMKNMSNYFLGSLNIKGDKIP